jgi:ATP-dependent helicase HrpB
MAQPTDDAIQRALASLVIGPDAIQFASLVGTTSNGVVIAEPGAGKTTGIPLALLDQPWLTSRSDSGIILVEPRRVAARQAATRMASLLGQKLSTKTAGVVGLRMRNETHVGPQTRIEVMTDGVLPRLLINDPGLSGRSVVIFDEFHERSLDVDLALALTLSARQLLRPDLVVIVMSATLEADRVSEMLLLAGGAGVQTLRSAGRVFPVAATLSPGGGDLADRVTAAVLDGLRNTSGDVLVFLPGVFEINRCSRRLQTHPDLQHVLILQLHARGTQEDTANALRPARRGERRIVLSTSLAQTSVTIDGVTAVVDSGLVRRPVRDADSGMTRLETMRVSAATAVQRAGRAGRTSPGIALQMWSASEAASFAPTDEPEILAADLSGPLLTALAWGVEPDDLAWVDPPLATAWSRAFEHLQLLGAVTKDHLLTPLGRTMSNMGTEPRIAALLATSTTSVQATTAAALAAYLSETGWTLPNGAAGAPVSIDLRQRIGELKDQPEFRRSMLRFVPPRGGKTASEVDVSLLGGLALRAFPERLARCINDAGHRYQFANGLILPFATGDMASLRGTDFLVALDMDSDKRSGSIRVAVSVTADEIRHWCSGFVPTRESTPPIHLVTNRTTTWTDDRLAAQQQQHLITHLGEIALNATPTTLLPHEIAEAISHRLSTEPTCVSLSESAKEKYAHILFAKQVFAEMVGDQSDLLAEVVHRWLVDTLPSQSPAYSLATVDVAQALRHWVNISGLSRALEQRFPTSITIGDRQHSIRYDTDSGRPTAAIRVQDLFGTLTTPCVDNGAQRVQLELLSPNSRVVAVTDDLARFWSVGYLAVRSELRGRYPKHQWPEDPTVADPRRMNHLRNRP